MSTLPRQTVTFLAGGAAVIAVALGGAAFALNEPTEPDATVEVREPVAREKITDLAYLVECVEDGLVQEPQDFTLTCADGNANLEGLVWSNWGTEQAEATGSLAVNSCEPDCANGTFETHPVALRLTDLDMGEASAVYTTMTVDFLNETPEGYSDPEVITFAGHSSPVEASGPDTAE